jgi:hypothetical protein
MSLTLHDVKFQKIVVLIILVLRASALTSIFQSSFAICIAHLPWLSFHLKAVVKLGQSGYIYSEIIRRLLPEIFDIAQKYLKSIANFNQSCSFYECETWYLILREEHRPKAFEKRVSRIKFRPNVDEVVGNS